MTGLQSTPILKLSPEILSIVCDNVSRHGLHALTLTCEFLKLVAIPKPYETVTLQVPSVLGCLASAESLASSPAENIRCIRNINVSIQHVQLGVDEIAPRNTKII